MALDERCSEQFLSLSLWKKYTTADVSTMASVLNLYVAVEMVNILNYLVVKYLQSMLMQCDLPPLQWWIAL